MSKSRYLLPGLGAALLLAMPAAMSASPSAYELGLEAAASYRYAAALAHFQAAAEQGDRSARRTLGLMLLYGEPLYGQEVASNREQARRWLQAAAADGCEVSAFMVRTLTQHAR
jgi:TPR repeat protein